MFWKGPKAGTASKPLKKLVVTVSILFWAVRAAFGAALRAAVRVLRVLRVVRRAERRTAAFSAAASRLMRRAVEARVRLAPWALSFPTFSAVSATAAATLAGASAAASA